MKQIIYVFSILVVSFTAHAKYEFDSSQLQMKNSDQMNELIRVKIKVADDAQASQKTEDDEIVATPAAQDALTDAMRVALSRPDQDGAREGMYQRIRRETNDLAITDKVLNRLATEALESLKSDGPPKVQATYITLLENMMAEIRPELENNVGYRKIVESIRDADIKISSKVRSQQLLQTMKKPVSPSETAAKILPKDKKKK